MSPVLPINRDRDRDNERERIDRDRNERASRGDRTDRGERTERSDKGDKPDKSDRGERDWKTNREAAASQENTGGRGGGTSNGASQTSQNSLFDRIGPLSNATAGLPSNPSGRRAAGSAGHEDISDARKRTLSDRDRDNQVDSGPKKVKIRREGLNDSGRILGKTLSSVYGSEVSRGEGRRGGNN